MGVKARACHERVSEQLSPPIRVGVRVGVRVIGLGSGSGL